MLEEQKIVEAVLKGDVEEVKRLVRAALERGDKADDIMNNGLTAGMDVVGKKMEAEEMYIPEVLVSAKAMSAGVEILKPHLTNEKATSKGKMVIGTVQGDLHDIGKNLVAMLMGGAGFTVVDLGTDVSPERFVDAVRKNGANLVGMSALLTTTMVKMRSTVEALEEAGIRGQVKILVGGAPVTEEYAKKIGVDGYARDAGSAVRVAKTLLAA